MLYKRRLDHLDICVLQISTDVLDLPGVAIADGNAAAHMTAFWRSPEGLAKIDRETTFKEFWWSSDGIELEKNRRAKCAEVLVPDRVEPRFIMGARVSCDQAAARVGAEVATIPVTKDEHLFFR
jgi:hypothetical protein